MRVRGTALGFCVLLGSAILAPAGMAEGTGQGKAAKLAPVALAQPAKPGRTIPATVAVHEFGRLSCVPYARMVTGMTITGNGGRWWHNAAGRYARGAEPEPGAVMAFRSTSWMPLGHVAVVSKVVGPRHVLIDHANWAGPGIRRGMVMRNVHVIDVSPGNDWSAVRVQTGWDPGTFGRVYPVYGFIYNRSEADTAYAAARPRYEEVAEMPPAAARR
jgi:hypothetical protein